MHLVRPAKGSDSECCNISNIKHTYALPLGNGIDKIQLILSVYCISYNFGTFQISFIFFHIEIFHSRFLFTKTIY